MPGLNEGQTVTARWRLSRTALMDTRRFLQRRRPPRPLTRVAGQGPSNQACCWHTGLRTPARNLNCPVPVSSSARLSAHLMRWQGSFESLSLSGGVQTPVQRAGGEHLKPLPPRVKFADGWPLGTAPTRIPQFPKASRAVPGRTPPQGCSPRRGRPGCTRRVCGRATRLAARPRTGRAAGLGRQVPPVRAYAAASPDVSPHRDRAAGAGCGPRWSLPPAAAAAAAAARRCRLPQSWRRATQRRRSTWRRDVALTSITGPLPPFPPSSSPFPSLPPSLSCFLCELCQLCEGMPSSKRVRLAFALAHRRHPCSRAYSHSSVYATVCAPSQVHGLAGVCVCVTDCVCCVSA